MSAEEVFVVVGDAETVTETRDVKLNNGEPDGEVLRRLDAV